MEHFALKYNIYVVFKIASGQNMEKVIELSSDSESDSEKALHSNNQAENVVDENSRIQLLINKYNTYKTSSTVNTNEDYNTVYLHTEDTSAVQKTCTSLRYNDNDQVNFEGDSKSYCSSKSDTTSITNVVLESYNSKQKRGEYSMAF